jgi:ABC-2 type transport system permease protein
MPADDAVNISLSWPKLMKDLFGDPIYGFTDVYGWLNLEVFHMTFWMVFGVYSSIIASRIVAKEIEENTVDILLSYPVTRTGLVLSRLTAAAIILALATLLTFAFTVIGLVILGMPVKLGILAAAFLSGFLLCLAFGGVSLLVSVFIPQQSYTLFITIGIMFAMFAYDELLIKVISFLEYLPFLSLFHYYRPNEILIHGSISAVNPMILLGYFALFSLAAIALFKRRDIPV